ncbi:MAG: cytochrome c biogenesis protein CcdA, partial [Candidatus Micrarchaeia archaeon]
MKLFHFILFFALFLTILLAEKNESMDNLTLISLISAALVDSINPCAFAVLIFLISYLISIGSKKRVLLFGIIYIIIIFIVYLASGFGVFSAIQTIHTVLAVRNFVGFLAIIFGLINVKDFFFYGKFISLEIPKEAKPHIKKLIAAATPISIIALGILVALVELPCTGGPYLTILTMLCEKVTMCEAIPYLIIYNLIFIAPLVIILLLVYFGYGIKEIERLRRKKRNYM